MDTWNDFFDDSGNRLNLGQLKFQTKHGKICPSYVDHVPARNVKSALTLVVRLLLEHLKVSECSSIIEDSVFSSLLQLSLWAVMAFYELWKKY